MDSCGRSFLFISSSLLCAHFVRVAGVVDDAATLSLLARTLRVLSVPFPLYSLSYSCHWRSSATLKTSTAMQQDTTPGDATLAFASYVPGRFKALIWSCLDASLPRSAAFYAERYYSLDRSNHDAKHLYATSLLRCGQVHSAMGIVNLAADQRCSGCSIIKAECCTALGRHSLAGEALEKSLTDPGDVFGKFTTNSVVHVAYTCTIAQAWQTLRDPREYSRRRLFYTAG